ncbi:MAG: hypothetical protein ACRDIA_02930, partial [Actinomycetota bacterium]
SQGYIGQLSGGFGSAPAGVSAGGFSTVPGSASASAAGAQGLLQPAASNSVVAMPYPALHQADADGAPGWGRSYNMVRLPSTLLFMGFLGLMLTAGTGLRSRRPSGSSRYCANPAKPAIAHAWAGTPH